MSEGLLKKRQTPPHKRTQIFILGNPHGEEIPTKIPLYRLQPSVVEDPKNKTRMLPLLQMDGFFSLVQLLECSTC